MSGLASQPPQRWQDSRHRPFSPRLTGVAAGSVRSAGGRGGTPTPSGGLDAGGYSGANRHHVANIQWALPCDLAFMDRQDRLCIIGIVRRFPVPALPLELHQVMLVARLTDIRAVDEVAVGVAVVTPAGRRTCRRAARAC